MTETTAFDDVLAALKISGMCLLAEEYPPPWAISIPDGYKLGKSIGVPPGTQVVAFHFVRKGAFELHTEGFSETINAGEVAILTGSQSHLMRNGTTDQIIDFADLLTNRPDHLERKGVAGTTELICGAFMLQNIENNPLIEALPPVIHVDVSKQTGRKPLYLLSELLAEQMTEDRKIKNYMGAKTLEMFYAEAIRDFVDRHGASRPGWFAGLSDPKIGIALNKIHARPEAPITVEGLAKDVGMSTSRFAARFRDTLKTSPMNYATRWRMNVASRLLIETELNIETIAAKVGYESPPSFTRAFSKHYKTPPARWRRQQTA